MPSGLSDSLGTSFGPLASYALAAVIVLALIIVVMSTAKRMLGGGGNQAMRKGPRLAVLDIAAIDQRRKLVLVRRDEVEHLVLVGGQNDLLVEGNILRTPAALRQPGQERFAGMRGESETIAPGPIPSSPFPLPPAPPRRRAAESAPPRGGSPLRRPIPRVESPPKEIEPAPSAEFALPFRSVADDPPPPRAAAVPAPAPVPTVEPVVAAPSPAPPATSGEPRLSAAPAAEPEIELPAPFVPPPPAAEIRDEGAETEGQPFVTAREPESKAEAGQSSEPPRARVEEEPAARIPSFLRRTDYTRPSERPSPPTPVFEPADRAPRSDRPAPAFIAVRDDGPERIAGDPILDERRDRGFLFPDETKKDDAQEPVPETGDRPDAVPDAAVSRPETVEAIEPARAERPSPPAAPPARHPFAARTTPRAEEKPAEPERTEDEPDPRPLSVRSFATVIQSRRQNFEAVRPESTWTGRAAQSIASPAGRPPPIPVPIPATQAPQPVETDPPDDASLLDDALTRELDSGIGALDWASEPPKSKPAIEPSRRAEPELAAPSPASAKPASKPDRPLTLEEEMERLLGDFDFNGTRR